MADVSLAISAFMGKITGPYNAAVWALAKTNCEARGQRLMTIDSQEEDDYVTNTLDPDFTYDTIHFNYRK